MYNRYIHTELAPYYVELRRKQHKKVFLYSISPKLLYSGTPYIRYPIPVCSDTLGDTPCHPGVIAREQGHAPNRSGAARVQQIETSIKITPL